MANLYTPTSPAPGGNLLAGAGGHLELWNWGQPQGTPPQPPVPINFRYLDVAHWAIRFKRIAQPNWYSGSVGQMRARIVTTSWTIDTRVWWDYAFPPELLLTGGDALAVKLTLGTNSAWTGDDISDFRNGPNGFNQPVNNPPTAGNLVNAFNPVLSNGLGILNVGDDYIPCWCAPMAILSIQNIHDSSEPDENGIVFQDLTLVGDSRLTYIFNPAAEQEYYDYLSQLVTQNFIPFN